MSDFDDTDGSAALFDAIGSMVRDGSLDMPWPGGGATSLRHRRLASFGRQDLSLGRVVEAHTDAIAILGEAGREPRDGAIYGVWAAERPGTQLVLRPAGDGFVLEGTKAFCTGVGGCTAALVTAESSSSTSSEDDAGAPRQRVLVDLDLAAMRAGGWLEETTAGWATNAFAATATGSIELHAAPIDQADLIGPAGWYLDRPGFWHGAIGPAAVWAGGALALIDTALDRSRQGDPHVDSQLGALRALSWNIDAMLAVAGDQIDSDPTDSSGRGAERALAVRHLVERQATEVMDRFGRATGPALLASDLDTARRVAELTLYIRQSHAERDLEALQHHAQERIARAASSAVR